MQLGLGLCRYSDSSGELQCKSLSRYSNRSLERSLNILQYPSNPKVGQDAVALGLKPAKTEYVKARRVLGCIVLGEFGREQPLQLLLIRFILQASYKK